MNMKKVLAVVLAVIMAVSAMAITVFADETKIPLYKVESLNNGKFDITVTYTIPVYGTYGYFTEGDYFVLDLKENANAFNPGWGNLRIDEITVNGFKTVAGANGTHTIVFGHVARDVITHTEDGNVIVDYPTVIPVDTTINGTSTITVVMNLISESQWNHPNVDSLKASGANVQFYDAVDGLVTGSYSNVTFWNPTVSFVDNSYNSTMEFVTDRDYITMISADATTIGSVNEMAWDHTLGNKDAILKADTVQLVVELTKPIVGRATYILWAANENKDVYETNPNWWYLNTNKKQVAVVVVDGKCDKLVFDVPVSALYDYNYGVWNDRLVITEEITLRDTVLEQDPTNADYLTDVDQDLYGKGVFADGSLGDLSWSQYGGGAKYKGNVITYALGGEAYEQNNVPTWDARYGAAATDIYLLATTANDDVVVEEVEDPVEPSTEEEEDVTVDVEEPAEDTNPGTGLALAVVPMLVAAVAVVASKRR